MAEPSPPTKASDDELLLRKFELSDAGVEGRLHDDFCDQLVKFGIAKHHVESFKESFDFDKLDFSEQPLKTFEQAEKEDNESELFVSRVEREELIADLEEASTGLSETEKLAKEARIIELDAVIRKLEKELGVDEKKDVGQAKKDSPAPAPKYKPNPAPASKDKRA